MSKFEDNLWARLERDHAPALLQSLAMQRRTRVRRWVGAAAGAVLLGTAAAIAPVYFGGTPPAYAVVDNPDGSVTLKVWEVRQFEEATAKLRERGIRAVAVPLLVDCPPEGRKIDLPVDQVYGGRERRSAPEAAFEITIKPERIPVDVTVVLGTEQNGEKWIAVGGLYARDQLPSCLAKPRS